jgi:hypothetical protein
MAVEPLVLWRASAHSPAFVVSILGKEHFQAITITLASKQLANYLL